MPLTLVHQRGCQNQSLKIKNIHRRRGEGQFKVTVDNDNSLSRSLGLFSHSYCLTSLLDYFRLLKCFFVLFLRWMVLQLYVQTDFCVAPTHNDNLITRLDAYCDRLPFSCKLYVCHLILLRCWKEWKLSLLCLRSLILVKHAGLYFGYYLECALNDY